MIWTVKTVLVFQKYVPVDPIIVLDWLSNKDTHIMKIKMQSHYKTKATLLLADCAAAAMHLPLHPETARTTLTLVP